MIPTILGVPTLWFAVVGILVVLGLAILAIDFAWERVARWRHERRRRRPVVVLIPRARVIAVPTVTRRKHPGAWS